MFVADEGVAAVMGCDAVVGRWCLVGRAVREPPLRPAGWLHGWRGLGVLVVWLVCPSAPGPHPNPLPSNGRGGMFVVDEGVAAVMGVVVVWLVGRFACPPPPLRVIPSLVAGGMLDSGWVCWWRRGVVVWLACPAPPRALTPTLSRPTGEGECLWRMSVLLRCEGMVVVWLVGRPRTAPTSGWLVAWMERVGCVGGLVGVPLRPGPSP